MGRENVSPDPYTLPQQPELDDLLRVLGRAIKLQVRTHVPAMVVGYVPPPVNKATVVVQTLQVVRVTDPSRLPANVVSVSPDAPPNTLATLAPIQLVNIPVSLAVGTQGGVTYPITAGDYGMLHISDRSLAAWLLAGAPCDPVLAATHALGDSVFYPGLRPDTAPIPPMASDPAATVVYGAAQVKLGDNTAALSATLAEPLVAALDAFANAVPVPQDGGAAIHTAFKIAWEIAKPLVASSKVKVAP